MIKILKFDKFKLNENLGGLFIIGWGLSGGFGGIRDYEVIQADSINSANKGSIFKIS